MIQWSIGWARPWQERNLDNCMLDREYWSVDYISVYKCLCEKTRLRILRLLEAGPLCVSHLQEILQEPQAKVSKQLIYLKRHGMVSSARCDNWTIYQIANDAPAMLEENLKCLQDVVADHPIFKQDQERRAAVTKRTLRTDSKVPVPFKVAIATAGQSSSDCCD